jgi:hypothetical protein
VTREGELIEYFHEIVEDRNPPRKPWKLWSVFKENPGVVEDPMPPRKPRKLWGALDKDQAVVVEIPMPPDTTPPSVIRQKLTGPYSVGTGWNVYGNAYSGGVYNHPGAVIYGVTTEGDMNWYRHDNYDSRGVTVRLTNPISYAKIFAAGDGVLYGVDSVGDLYWYRHLDAANSSTEPKWSGRLKVGNGWGQFVHVFSTGQGVIYAVLPDGRLLWYRHKGYQTGADDWQGPKEVGTGWAQFRTLFSTGEGRIYAIQANGDLYAYHHVTYEDGGLLWNPPRVIGHGFDRFAYVFPAMWGTPPPIRVRSGSME